MPFTFTLSSHTHTHAYLGKSKTQSINIIQQFAFALLLSKPNGKTCMKIENYVQNALSSTTRQQYAATNITIEIVCVCVWVLLARCSSVVPNAICSACFATLGFCQRNEVRQLYVCARGCVCACVCMCVCACLLWKYKQDTFGSSSSNFKPATSYCKFGRKYFCVLPGFPQWLHQCQPPTAKPPAGSSSCWCCCHCIVVWSVATTVVGLRTLAPVCIWLALHAALLLLYSA